MLAKLMCNNEICSVHNCNNLSLFRDNLVKTCINECFHVLALINIGACVTAINVETLRKLMQAGQRCKIYQSVDLIVNKKKLSSASAGDILQIIGQIYIQVQLGSLKLNERAYVIPNLTNYFIMGIDVIHKYRMIIDYDKSQLFINQTTRLTTTIVIKPDELKTRSSSPTLSTETKLLGIIETK